ncbi:outer membrane beta-barrel protein [Mucilaginibacter lacusdianchii]|uniref:outer membrane beta-barrel protein n=1 Tax=Mucilaginibacter lacusdianchii TaxID=2684211 RepID=UPI00131EAEE3|nr:outer membrane beta-barrel protein [Mucilaginibacter sp. JXJ CY 39]
MKTVGILILLLCSLSVSFAQNHITIKGRVIDSLDKKPLELSTVAIVNVKDTSLIAYMLSKKNGEFELRNLSVGANVKLVVSFVTYKTYVKVLKPSGSAILDVGTIELSSKMLNEVVVKGERVPIVVKKDTIEFNAEAFKTRPNAEVEELLKKLPGVQVNRDGSITVNGKTVSKVLIDGKEFFGNDLRVATRNLDAEIVSQIQVYDDRENDPDHLVSETKVPKIINLKLKKAIKRSIFGKVFAGGGTRDRYETAGLFNLFRDTLQVSVIGLSNNLNRTAFSNQELYEQGGFNRAGSENLYNGSVNTGGQNWGGGIEKITSGGFNLNTDYGKKLKLNLLYFYSQKQNAYETSVYQQRFLRDTTLLASATSTQHSDEYNHAVTGLVDWKPDTLHSLRYQPKVNISNMSSNQSSFSDNYNNFKDHLNSNTGENSQKRMAWSFQQDFTFNKRFKDKKGESLTVGHNLQISPNQSDGFNSTDLVSYASTLPSSSLRRYVRNTTRNTAANLNVSYRYPFTKKLIVDLTSSGSYSNTGETVLNYDKNLTTGQYDIFLQDQSSKVKRGLWVENVKPGITYQLAKSLSVIAGATAEWQQVNNKFTIGNLNQKYFYWLPSLRIEAGAFSVSYSRSVNQPPVSSMQPVTIVYNQLYKFTGNPLLKPSSSNNVYVNFYKYIPESEMGFNFYGSFSASKNDVISRQNIDNNGGQATSFVNRNGQLSGNGGLNFNKGFKKFGDWEIDMNSSLSVYYNHRLNIINDVEGWQNSYSGGVSHNVTLNWKDKVELNTGGSFRPVYTQYNYNDYKRVYIRNWGMNNNLVVRWPKKVIWETKQDYNYNSQVSAGFQKGINVVSSSIALQMLKKDKGELKFTVYDLFDQNVNVFRFTGVNSIMDVQNNSLKRYFLLTYTFRFNKLSTK